MLIYVIEILKNWRNIFIKLIWCWNYADMYLKSIQSLIYEFYYLNNHLYDNLWDILGFIKRKRDIDTKTKTIVREKKKNIIWVWKRKLSQKSSEKWSTNIISFNSYILKYFTAYEWDVSKTHMCILWKRKNIEKVRQGCEIYLKMYMITITWSENLFNLFLFV